MSQVSSDDEDYNPSLCVPTSSGAPPNVRPTTASSMDTSSHEVCSSVHMNHAGNPGTSAGTTKSSSSISMPWVRLSGIKGRVRCMCTNPSGTILCAAGDDGVLCMWDFNCTIESRQVKPTRTLTPFVNRIVGLQPIVSLHSAADGSYFVACQDGDRPALIACTGKQLGFCAMGERGPLNVVQCKGHRAPVTSASADLKDAACFFTGSQDGTARLWNKATYERQSVFAVQHGSGQLDDRVAVEAVCGLSGPSLPSFATGGADGCVQLWDARVKYRPGGSVATWDVYAHLAASGLANMDEVFERHVGGLMEIPVGEGHGLVARVGSAMVVMDLRRPFTPSGTFLGKGMGMGSLPCCDDTTPVVGSATAGEWLTCTSRAGFGQGSGGHVVQFGPSDSNGDSYSWDVSGAWPVSGSDEDVCCVCADPLHNGVFFAGMSNGDVAVRLDATAGTPVDQWLATKPEATQTTHRDAQKRPRDAPEWDHDLF